MLNTSKITDENIPTKEIFLSPVGNVFHRDSFLRDC